jgi:CubicO group peptidase (beta-lactamase class C family)
MEEKGEINLLNPISHYIPEFARHGKERTTIYHLLSHRAGIPGIADVDDPRVVLDHEQSLQLLCEAQPQHLFGREQAYHAITGGVILAEIVRRVSGMDIRKAWRTWFKEPMGLKVLDYGASAPARAKIAEQALTGIQGCRLVDDFARRAIGATFDDVMELLATADFYKAVIPSGNMVSTAEEVGAFYQMLLDGGRWNGRQILRPETIQRATMEVGPHVLDRSIGVPLRFSQGFMLGGAPLGLFGQRSQHAFGHIGLANNITWADPERQISVALLVSGIPVLAGNYVALLKLIARIGGACPRVEN